MVVRGALTVLAALFAGCLAQPGAPTPMPPDNPPEPICDGTASTNLAPARLLTRFEYDNTIRDLFSLADNDPLVPSAGFPPENRALGFDNNADAHVVSPLLVRKYLDAGERVSEALAQSHLAALLPCDPVQLGNGPCGHQLIEKLLPRAYRRTPTTAEHDAMIRFFDHALTADDFPTAVKLTLQVVLQSPQFLYRLEPSAPGEPGVQLIPVEPFELATRLSYFLWASMPDDELLTAAADGRLAAEPEIQLQVTRMLDDPRAGRTIRHFYRQWLKLENLEKITKDKTTFREYTDDLRGAWQTSIESYLVDVLLNGGGTLEQLLLEPTTFMDPRLATLYGVTPAAGSGFGKVSLPAGYAGLLTQPALMALLALPEQGSPIQRGVFVRTLIMCEKLDPPPANRAIMPPDPNPNLTTRERFKQHTADPFCGGCHVKIDPVGFGFERFDALGRIRASEAGKPIDDSGELISSRDHALDGKFRGAVELSERLAHSKQVSDCAALYWFRYAMGRDAGGADACSLVNAQRAFADSRGTFRNLIVALTQTDAFRLKVAEDAP